jgi:hypothetical protein
MQLAVWVEVRGNTTGTGVHEMAFAWLKAHTVSQFDVVEERYGRFGYTEALGEMGMEGWAGLKA